MVDLQVELGNAIVEHMEKFDSIEPKITNLQSQFSQMETHVDRCFKEMDYVSLKCFSSVTLLFECGCRRKNH